MELWDLISMGFEILGLAVFFKYEVGYLTKSVPADSPGLSGSLPVTSDQQFSQSPRQKKMNVAGNMACFII